MKFPRHVEMTIVHQPQAASYESVEEWLDSEQARHVRVSPEDRAAMVAAEEIWEVHWYPDTPIGFIAVAAATLERALEIANSL